MRAGKLRHLVTIQSAGSPTKTAQGEDVPQWTDVSTVWASIDPVSGRQFLAAGGQHAEVTHSVRLRYLSGLTRKHRVKFGSRIFAIEAVLPPAEATREMELLCVERT